MIGKIIEINDIFEWNKRISFYIKRQCNEYLEMVCGHKLRNASICEESHRKCSKNGQSNRNIKIKIIKTEHKNWYRSRISWY